jgi:23S rRNA (adenine2030-N6)-methyltransferase
VLSYRHSYHAGNLGDVLKHSALCAVLSAVVAKETPLFYLDTHAGAGRYRLDDASDAEHHAGVGVLRRADAPPPVATLLNCIAAENAPGRRRFYPGSPAIAARLLRPDDRLRFAELHPQDHALLAKTFAGDTRVKVGREDGYALLASDLPPRERRGVVLIDPAYERADEDLRLLDGLERGLQRFRHGSFLIWLPLAGKLDVRRMTRRFRELEPPKTFAIDVTPSTTVNGAIASAVWILNPPYQAVQPLEAVARYFGGRASWLIPE